MVDFSLEGPKWTTSSITWDFAAPGDPSFTNAITPAYQAAIRAAAAAWSNATHLNIQEVAPGTAGVDIKVGWGSFAGTQIGETEYSYSLGATQAFLPGLTIHIEDPSIQALSPADGSFYQNTTTTLNQVALHEFGHALGLGLSTDPTAIMNLRLGPTNTAIGASDLAGITSLYGTQTSVAASSVPLGNASDVVPLSGDNIGVYRFFDGQSGTQFLTSSVSEISSIFATRADLKFEGLALAGIAPGAADPNASPVYRFYDRTNGAHFFTASKSEADTLSATRSDMVQEQSSFSEHTTQQAGDSPVYRFFDTNAGTHFFTASASEQASIIATRSDLTYEGVAFYSPKQG